MPTHRFICCLCLLAGFPLTGVATPGVVARPDTTAVTDLTRSVAYFVDPTGRLPLATVRQQAYQSADTDVLNFRFSPDVVWLRFTLRQPANTPQNYVLQLSNWYIDDADLYSPQPNGGFRAERAGNGIPLHQRAIKSRYPTFAVRLPDSQPYTFYLRLTNSQYNNFTVKLWPRTLFFDVKLSGDSADFALGLIAMRLAFHVALLLFLFGDQKFRAYSLFGISVCLIYFFSGGNGSIIFPDSPYLANVLFFVCLSLTPASLSYLVSIVLNVPTHLPRFVPVLWLFGAVGLVNLVVNLFGHHAYISWAFVAFMSLMLFTFLVVIIWLLAKGVRPTVWYMIPMLIYIPSFCLYYARNAGLHSLPMTEVGMRSVFFVEFLCVPFIIAVMLRTAYRERLAIAKDLYLRQAESDSLRQLDRAKTNFFTDISHEFRLPRTPIVGPLNDLRQRFPALADRQSGRDPVSRPDPIADDLHFPVLVNRDAQAGLNQALPSIPTEQPTDNRPLVLIVEDNDDLRVYIRSILGEQYRVLEAADGQHGLEMVQETPPDLIVTDLIMPRLDGLELCRQLRQNEQTNHIAIVMLTARAALNDRLQGLETGADDYLTKPFVAAELLVRVQNLLRRQDNLRQYLRSQLLSEPGRERKSATHNNAMQVVHSERQQAFIERIYKQIDQHIEQPAFSVETLAEAVAMSSRTLNRKLNTLVGMTAGEVIRSYRLRRAAELLRQGISPTETAYRVGFESPSHFSRTFREQFRQSPSAYAKTDP